MTTTDIVVGTESETAETSTVMDTETQTKAGIESGAPDEARQTGLQIGGEVTLQTATAIETGMNETETAIKADTETGEVVSDRGMRTDTQRHQQRHYQQTANG